MEVALESMADGGVLVGIQHPVAMKIAAHVMIVSLYQVSLVSCLRLVER